MKFLFVQQRNSEQQKTPSFRPCCCLIFTAGCEVSHNFRVRSWVTSAKSVTGSTTQKVRRVQERSMYNGEIPGRKQEGKTRAVVKADSAKKLYLSNTQSQHVANAVFVLAIHRIDAATPFPNPGDCPSTS